MNGRLSDIQKEVAYMGRKTAVLLSACFLLCGCTSPSRDDLSSMELEPYRADSVEDEYQYLSASAFETDHAFISVWTIGENTGKKTYSGTAHGVSLKVGLIDSDEQKTAGMILEKELDTVVKDLEDPVIYDVIQGNGYWLQEVDHSYTEGDLIYPCVVYIKVDDLTDGNYLSSVLSVDNRYTDQETNAVLKELFDAYGINIEKEG